MTFEWIVVGTVWIVCLFLIAGSLSEAIGAGRALKEYLEGMRTGALQDPQIQPLLAHKGVTPAAVGTLVSLKGEEFASRVPFTRISAQLGVYIGLLGTVLGLAFTAWQWSPSTGGATAASPAGATTGFAVAFLSALAGVLTTILLSALLHGYDNLVERLEQELTRRALDRLSMHDTASRLAEEMQPQFERLVDELGRMMDEMRRVSDKALESMRQTHQEAVEKFSTTLADQSKVVEQIRQGVEEAANGSIELLGRLSQSVSQGLADVGAEFGKAATKAVNDMVQASLKEQTEAIGRLEETLANVDAFSKEASNAVMEAAQNAARGAASEAMAAQRQAIDELRRALEEAQAQSDQLREAVNQLSAATSSAAGVPESLQLAVGSLDKLTGRLQEVATQVNAVSGNLTGASDAFESLRANLREVAGHFADRVKELEDLQQKALEARQQTLREQQVDLQETAAKLQTFVGLAIHAIYDALPVSEADPYLIAGRERFDELSERLEELRNALSGREPVVSADGHVPADLLRPVFKQLESVASDVRTARDNVGALQSELAQVRHELGGIRARLGRKPWWLRIWSRGQTEA
ncbi:MAG: hypothetical protein WHU10_00275 [Fimbriimonadales bacterium]